MIQDIAHRLNHYNGSTLTFLKYVSKTYSIQDGIYANTFLENYNGISIVTTDASASISSTNGLTVTGTTANSVTSWLSHTLPSTFIVEADIVALTYGDYNVASEFVVSDVSITNRYTGSRNATTIYWNGGYSDLTYHSAPFHLKAVVDSSNVTFYIDDVEFGSHAKGTNSNFGFRTYQNRGITLKNLVIKPL